MAQKSKMTDNRAHVHVVEASAGSGKTYTLAKRYVSLLLNPPPDLKDYPLPGILAITFMNKAAIEMKERILDMLKRIALDEWKTPQEEKVFFEGLKLDKEIARKRAVSAMNDIIRNYNYFQVQTIDSFINALLIGCAFRIHLSANFNIKKDSTRYLAYGLDVLIDRAAQDKNVHRLFREFIFHYLEIEQRTGWLVKRDILGVMQALFSDYNRYGEQFVSYPSQVSDILNAKKKILGLTRGLSQMLPQGTNKRFVNVLDDFIDAHPVGFNMVDFSSTYWTWEEVPVNKGVRIDSLLEDTWRELKEGLEALSRQEAYSLFNPYIEIFSGVIGNFKELAKKEDVLFLEELNKQACVLFRSDPVSLPEIYYRLATRFRHYLIDEFQDTSFLQWQNMDLMVHDALASGGSLFYVGDKKQAVYRFRGGDVGLFDGIKKRFGSYGVDHAVLNKNFRSAREIVDFNNKVFSRDNLARFIADFNGAIGDDDAEGDEGDVAISGDEAKVIFDYFKDAEQEGLAGSLAGQVNIVRFSASDAQEQDDLIREKLLALIRDLNEREFPCQDIAILTRSNEDVENISAWLIEAGIPVESEKTLNIRENGGIKEIISLLVFLDSPINDLAFASFILGDIFCAASGIAKAKIEEFLFERNLAKEKNGGAYLYRSFRARFPLDWDMFLDEFFKNVGFVPLYEMLTSIFEKFGVLARFGHNQGFFMALLELVKNEEADHVSLAAFLEFFENAPKERLYVRMPRTNAVKIMTVHKAKGLEFPVVVIPYFKMSLKVGSRTDTAGVRYIAESCEEGLRLLNLKSAYRKFSPQLESAYRAEYARSFQDELNNAYVAFTRAKQEMHIFLSSVTQRINPAQHLIPETFTQSGAAAPGLPQKNIPDSRITLPAAEYRDWLHFLKEEFVDVSLLKHRRRLLRGEVIHYLLSFIGGLTPESEREVLFKAAQRAKQRYPYYEGFQEAIALTEKLVHSQDCTLFFYSGKDTVFTEKDVADGGGRLHRIDRLIITEEDIHILDYKTSVEEDQAHDEQMRGYIRLLKSLNPQKMVRGYLLYIDACRLKEVVHGK